MSIWKTEPTIEALNFTRVKTLVGHLDIKFTEIGPDYLKATMPVDERTKQPFGLLHGGASAVLSETMGSVASTACLEDLTKQYPVGIEVNANHLRAAKSGLVTGICKAIRIGRKIHVWETNIYDENEKQICSSRLTVMIVDRK